MRRNGIIAKSKANLEITTEISLEHFSTHDNIARQSHQTKVCLSACPFVCSLGGATNCPTAVNAASV